MFGQHYRFQGFTSANPADLFGVQEAPMVQEPSANHANNVARDFDQNVSKSNISRKEGAEDQMAQLDIERRRNSINLCNGLIGLNWINNQCPTLVDDVVFTE